MNTLLINLLSIYSIDLLHLVEIIISKIEIIEINVIPLAKNSLDYNLFAECISKCDDKNKNRLVREALQHDNPDIDFLTMLLSSCYEVEDATLNLIDKCRFEISFMDSIIFNKEVNHIKLIDKRPKIRSYFVDKSIVQCLSPEKRKKR